MSRELLSQSVLFLVLSNVVEPFAGYQEKSFLITLGAITLPPARSYKTSRPDNENARDAGSPIDPGGGSTGGISLVLWSTGRLF